MSELEWKNLKSYRCPRCGAKMWTNKTHHVCMNPKCEFRIGQKRFDDIVYSLNNKKEPVDEYEANLSALNNM
jgi:DNA-directed RNA polymerase subunit RPC12/RpoP